MTIGFEHHIADLTRLAAAYPPITVCLSCHQEIAHAPLPSRCPLCGADFGEQGFSTIARPGPTFPVMLEGEEKEGEGGKKDRGDDEEAASPTEPQTKETPRGVPGRAGISDPRRRHTLRDGDRRRREPQ